MMRASFAAALAAAAALTGCSQGHDLPDMPTVPAGQGFQGAQSFSTDKVLALCAAANSASLDQFSDREIANGTCEMGALAVEMISRGEDPDQTCVAADAAMIREFEMRFPDHRPDDVIGRC